MHRDDETGEEADATAAEREPEWQRRRRLAAVFGEDAPDQTSDDRDPPEDRPARATTGIATRSRRTTADLG